MSTPTLGLLFTVPLAGFANPRYISGDPVNDSAGFDISRYDVLVIAFESAHTATIVAEQTLDPAGVAGWFPVQGRTIGSSNGQLTSSGNSNLNCYVYPQVGARMRFRVTALTVADMVARVAFNTSYRDISTTVGAVSGHDTAISGNPIRIGGRAVSANYTAVSSGDTADIITTLAGAQVHKSFSIPELDWQATGTKTDTTDLVVKAAGAAGIKNYMTGLQYHNISATASDIVVKRGSTVIWTGRAPASMSFPAVVTFPTPLQSAAAEALNVALLTTATDTRINAQGYQAP